MKLENFFKGRVIGFGVLLVFLLIFFIIKTYFSNPKEVVISPEILDSTKSEAISFDWKYEKSDSLNLDGNPNTNVLLEIKYENGIIQNKLIDTVPMGCNILPDTKEEIIAPNSTITQCYGAGLGYWYKITKGNDSYKVERKTFEEALPDFEPPLYQYEVISEFPVSV